MTTHILVVEDDENLRVMITHMLQRMNYQVTQAADGERAVELLTQSAAQQVVYDIVLTDIVMGQTNGIEVMQVARSQAYAPEVILLTGHSSLTTAIEAVRRGAFDYILKPCPREALLERVSTCAEQRKTRLDQRQRAEALDKITELITRIPQGSDTPAPSLTAEPINYPLLPQERHLRVGLLHIDTHRHEVRFDDQVLHVTPTEYMILAALAATPGQVLPYSEIIRHTHGYLIEAVEAHGLLRTHIRNLRRKFDRRYLVSVYAVGYMLIDPDEPEAASPG